jgi:hypothetical protein
MTDMDQVLTLNCCYSCCRVQVCAAASAPLLVFTLGWKAISLKVAFFLASTGHLQAIDQHQLGWNQCWGRSSWLQVTSRLSLDCYINWLHSCVFSIQPHRRACARISLSCDEPELWQPGVSEPNYSWCDFGLMNALCSKHIRWLSHNSVHAAVCSGSKDASNETNMNFAFKVGLNCDAVKLQNPLLNFECHRWLLHSVTSMRQEPERKLTVAQVDLCSCLILVSCPVHVAPC